MAFVSGEQGSGLLGRIFTALGKTPKLGHDVLVQEAELPQRDLWSQYAALLGPQKSGLEDFSKAYSALTPQVARMAQQDVGTYDQLIKSASARDPIADMGRLGDYGFGKLTEWGKNMADYGVRDDNLRKAAAGLGNRGPTAYDNILSTNRITGNLLPAFNNIISNIGPNYSRASQDYFGNLAAIPGLMAGRYEALDKAPFRSLLPSQIQRQQLMGNQDAINQMVQGQLANAYFFNEPNQWQKLGDVFSGIYGGIFDAADAASKVASAYGNVMTSGLGNVGGGGGMGGAKPDLSGGGSDLNTGQFPGESNGAPIMPSGYTPQTGGAFSPSPIYGGYGVGYQQPPIAAPPGNAFSPSPIYGGYGIGYGQPSASGLSYTYGMGYNQNPYAQYGAYF